MSTSAPIAARLRKKRQGIKLFLIAIPFLAYIFAFSYVPLFGWSYAFYNFKPMFGSDLSRQQFEGFGNFIQIWRERKDIVRVLRNTLALSALGLLCSPLSVILAIMFAEIRHKRYLRFVQTVTTFPNFISWIIVYGIAYTIFSNTGVIANLKVAMGLPRQTVSPLGNLNGVWEFQTMLGVWKGVGWSAIIYCATIAGIDETLYEAARIDGAGKLRCIWHITLPGIRETFFVLLLLSLSNILNNGFDHYFVFNNSMVTDKLLTLDLYTYRMGIQMLDYSYAIATGMTKTAVSLTLLFGANALSKRVRGNSLI